MIRRAVVADAAAIAHAHRCSREESGFSRPITTQEWEGHLGGQTPTWVWEAGGVIVGFASVDGELLKALYVLPGVQRTRVGTALLDFAVAHGARELEVYVENAGPRAFYERRGWRLVGPADDASAVRYSLDA